MGRSPSSCDKIGLKRGPWTPEEDEKLVSFITQRGHDSWRALPKLTGLNRCGKSCRLRWTNYLRPDIKRGNFSQEEQQTILNLHSILGNKWSVIASQLPGRTDNEIKNFWNTHLKKRLIQMGFDPITHMPTTFSNTISLHFLSLQHLQIFPPLEHQDEALQMASLQGKKKAEENEEENEDKIEEENEKEKVEEIENKTKKSNDQKGKNEVAKKHRNSISFLIE